MLKDLIGEELYKQVAEKLGDKKVIIDDGSLVNKQELEQLKQSNSELSKQIKDRDKQLEDLSKNVKDNETLTNQIKELQNTNKQTSEEYEAKISKMQFDYAVDSALTSAKTKNAKALKALLDMESIKYQDGKLDGLETQLSALKESDSYLFESEAPASTGSTGNFGNKGNKQEPAFNFNFQGVRPVQNNQ